MKILTSFVLLLLFLVGAVLVVGSSSNLPFDCAPSNFINLKPEQRITCENTLPGNPSNEWDINAHGDPTIQGFSTDISYHVGTTASFKIATSEDTESYRIDIFRMGYYNGLGARKVATINPDKIHQQQQPKCKHDTNTWEYNCREWKISASWEIPKDAASGVYIARPVRTDNKPHATWRVDNSQAGDDPRFAMPGVVGKPKPGPHKYGANGMGELRNPMKEPRASHIYFVVRDDSARSDIVFQTADTVWQAYNPEGGANMYYSFDPNVTHRTYKASLDRPLRTREIRPANAFLGSEFPMIQFLEKHGYSVTYISGVDTDRLGADRLLQHKLFLSVGHDEYWSGPQRANLEEAISKGLNVAFLSGNEMFWRIRWEDNYRTMVVYKETQHPTKLDPNLTEWTGTWRDSRDINPIGGKPENAVIGQLFTINAWRNDPLVVPRRYASLRWWKNTKVADMLKDENKRQKFVAYLRGIIGHEADEIVDNGFTPPGVIAMSETHVDNCMYVIDYGSSYDSGHGIHRLSLYRHQKSGAMVFGAGTCQWSWALSGFHDSETGIPAGSVNHLNTRVGNDIFSPVKDIQQFTVTMFNEMNGVKPFYYASSSASTTTYDQSLLPQWYVEAVEHDETFKVLDLPVDKLAPFCKIYQVEFDPEVHSKIFPDTRDGNPELYAKVFVDASDLGGGVVAGAEVSVMFSNYSRWHIAFSAGNPDEDVLSSENTKWMAEVPLREMELPEASIRNVELVKESILSMGKCRATDDSLNTNFEEIVDENDDFAEERRQTEKRMKENRIPTSKKYLGKDPMFGDL